ncbi:Uncharacterised protein [Bordetella pertussis]|nr:Uncharacterised protein [Bordetella pertussis]
MQLQHRDVGRDALYRLHPRRQLADLDVAGQPHFGGLDHQVALRLGLTEQRVALREVLGRQDLGRIGPRIHLAGDNLALAGRTRAGTAAIGQHNAGRQGRIQDRLAGLGLELVLAGFDSDLETHSDTNRK